MSASQPRAPASPTELSSWNPPNILNSLKSLFGAPHIVENMLFTSPASIPIYHTCGGSASLYTAVWVLPSGIRTLRSSWDRSLGPSGLWTLRDSFACTVQSEACHASVNAGARSLSVQAHFCLAFFAGCHDRPMPSAQMEFAGKMLQFCGDVIASPAKPKAALKLRLHT